MLPDLPFSDTAKGGYCNSIIRGGYRAASVIPPNLSDHMGRQFSIHISLANLDCAVSDCIRAIRFSIPPIKVFWGIVQRLAVDMANHRLGIFRLPQKCFRDKTVDFLRLNFPINTNRNLRPAGAIYTLHQNLHFAPTSIRNGAANSPKIGSLIVGCARYRFPVFHNGNNGTKQALGQQGV